GLAEQVVRSRGRRDLKRLANQVAAAMDRHGVLTDATAIAFRMLFALAFLSLTGLAFAGAVHLEGIWSHQIGPNIARIVSPHFYRRRPGDRRRRSCEWGRPSCGWASARWFCCAWLRCCSGSRRPRTCVSSG